MGNKKNTVFCGKLNGIILKAVSPGCFSVLSCDYFMHRSPNSIPGRSLLRFVLERVALGKSSSECIACAIVSCQYHSAMASSIFICLLSTLCIWVCNKLQHRTVTQFKYNCHPQLKSFPCKTICSASKLMRCTYRTPYVYYIATFSAY